MIAGVLLGYLAAVVWLTWPLAAHLGTHLPNTHPACNFDLLQTAWVLAHETRALTTAPATLTNAPIYHPATGALFYADAAFGALPFFLPPFLATGNPTLAVNLTLLVPAALTALALHLVVRAWTGSHVAGALAGWTFLTTRWTLWDFAPTAPQYAALLWFPPIVFLATRPTSRRRDLGLAALIALQGLSSPVYVSAAVLLPLGAIVATRLVRPGQRREGLRLLGAMALGVALLAPVVTGYVAVRIADPDLAQQTYWRWWRPVTDLPWGPFTGYQIPTAVPAAALALALAGLVSLALPWRAGAAPVSWRIAGHVALWAVAGVLLGITPAATWNGEAIRIPQTLLAEWLPLYRTFRETARLGVAGLMGLSLAAGLGFAACAARLPARARQTGLIAALLAAVIGGEMYREYRRPGAYEQPALPPAYPLAPAVATAADPLVRALAAGDGPVLEVPVDLTIHGCIPGRHAQAMYRAIFHHRPLLNGYGGYWPDGFIERMLLASRLPDASALAALRAETGLTTVVVNTRALGPDELASWRTALAGDAPGLRPIGRYDDAVLFDARGS